MAVLSVIAHRTPARHRDAHGVRAENGRQRSARTKHAMSTLTIRTPGRKQPDEELRTIGVSVASRRNAPARSRAFFSEARRRTDPALRDPGGGSAQRARGLRCTRKLRCTGEI